MPRDGARREMVPLPAPEGPSIAMTTALEDVTSTIIPGMSPRRKATLVASALVVAGLCWFAWPFLESAAFILDLTGRGGLIRAVLPVRAHAVTSRDLSVPTRFGPIPARLYQPSGPAARSIIVFPGIHAGGVDEPRLAAFSSRLAATGATVLSVPLPDLRAYSVTPRSTDMVEDATLWMANDRTLAPRGRVAMAGISFGGGLALVAAGRPSLTNKIDLVVSLGGHGDLPRVLRYLCTGRLADGTTRAPHDFGVVILLLAAMGHLVPPDQIAPLRQTITTYLDAASYETTDPTRAAALLSASREAAARLGEPARTIMSEVEARDLTALAPRVMPYIEEFAGAPGLSAERSAPTRVPVYLLHGEEDNVIPPTETPSIAAYLRASGNTHIEWLLTPLISHADTQGVSSPLDVWKVIRFWKDVLGDRH